MATPKRWTKDQARSILRDHVQSGLSIAAFARLRGVHPERVRRLQARHRVESAAHAPRLVELVPPALPERVRLQIHCPSGHTIAFEDAGVVAGLRSALRAVAEVTGC